MSRAVVLRRSSRHPGEGARSSSRRRAPSPRRTLPSLALLLAACLSGEEESVPPPDRDPPPSSPLFTAHLPLELELEADFSALQGDRDPEAEEERPGTLRLEGETAGTVELDVQLRTRGNFRLRRSTCSFPPLRLNLKKNEVEGTVFEGQDKLKLVTHCRDGSEAEENVLQEYAVYRMYGDLTDAAYRVRLARIAYTDTGGTAADTTRWAFFIEDDDALAARLRGMLVEPERMHPGRYDGMQAARLALFHYMVGNTDWSAVFFHNTDLLRTGRDEYVPVPYDFDWSGIVDADYAVPDPRLGIDDVRDRLYRGYCWPGVEWERLFEEFRSHREGWRELVRGLEGMRARTREETVAYLDEFFRILESETRRERDIVEACLSW